MQKNRSLLEVLTSPGHLISLAARGFARLSEARLKPIGFGAGHLPVLVALQGGQARSQKDLARFAHIEQPSMAQMQAQMQAQILAPMDRDGLITRMPDPADGRSTQISLSEAAQVSLPHACTVWVQGNRDALKGFTVRETSQFISLLTRLIANLDRIGVLDYGNDQ